MDVQSQLPWLFENPLVSAFRGATNSIRTRREALGLINPGTVENLSREVQKDVLLTNHMFSGLRADLTKSFSVNPLFQISHSFSMGAQGLPPYTLATLYGTNKVFMQANLDSEGQLSARLNFRWSDGLVTKCSTQLATGPGQSVFTMDNDYTGKDFSASLKTYNPSILDGSLTGIFIGSYLQSITPKLALGLEMVYQRPGATVGPETAMSYVARYATKEWIATAQLQAQGALQATYWRKIADKLDVGAECQLAFAGGPGGGLMGGEPQKQGLTTVGAKYEFRASTLRAQIDSNGRLGVVLEKRVAPAVSLTFAGDMDHMKSQARIGMGLSVEAAGEDLMEQQEKVATSQASPTAPPF